MRHSGAPDPSSQRDERIHTAPAKTARVLGLLQLTGSFLAIPVALGSAYTVYQANFSPETQCQSLRANIIAMIDKQIDAGARRMLVRRDVETFETSCGAFDPDAKAAFATLLAPAPAKVDAAKAPPAKAEPAKIEATKAEAPAKTAAREAGNPDARWLEAVRSALVTPREPIAAPAAKPLGTLVTRVPQAAAAAPVLPPATPVPIPAPSEHATDPDRPVPPAAIPDAPPLDIANASVEPRGGNGASWLSQIPLLGPALAR